MNTATIDNNIDAVLDKIVIWQYDDSTSICALIDHFKRWFYDTTGSVWDSVAKEFNLSESEDVSDYTLSLMGKILGIPRQNVVVDGETRTMSKELYRRIIVAKFRLLNSNGSFGAYTKFVDDVFGGNVNIENNQDMSVSVEWIGEEPSTDDEKELKYAFDNLRGNIFIFPTGVEERGEISGLRFWLGSTSESRPEEDVNGGGFNESSFNWEPISISEPNGVKLTFTVPESASSNTVRFIVEAPTGTPILDQSGSVVASCAVDGVNTIVINPTIGDQSVFYIGENATTFRFYDPDNTSFAGTPLLTAVDNLAWNLKHLQYSFRGCTNLASTGNIRALVNDISSAYYGTSITSVPILPDSIKSIRSAFRNCSSLAYIQDFPVNCIDAYSAFSGCTSLRIPNYRWRNVINAAYCYDGCSSLIRIYPWSQNGFAGSSNRIILENASYTYRNCTSASIMKYRDANGVTQDVPDSYNYMPSVIKSHSNCVTGANATLRKKFSSSWGGTK